MKKQQHPNPQISINFRLINSIHGGVLVLLAVIAAVLVTFAALTIDTLELSTSHSQQRQSAEYIALGALEAFFKIDPEGTPVEQYQARLEAAKKRAEEIGGLNFVIAGMQHEIAQSGQFGYNAGQPVSTGSGEAGILLPGRWWYSEPVGTCSGYTQPEGNTCPCHEGEWQGPCFSENAPTDYSVTAFQVKLSTPQESPLRTVFASFFGQSSFALKTSAAAAKVPKRGVFLVDTSVSATFDTHLDTPEDSRERYVYQLRSTGTCPAGKTCTCPIGDGEANVCPQDACAIAGGYPSGDLYNGYVDGNNVFHQPVPNFRGDPPIQGPSTLHFKNDYACYTVNYKNTKTGTNYTEHYLADTLWTNTTQGPDYYGGPEPLNTILYAMNTAITQFENRSVKGDYMGALFFDDQLDIDKRTFPLVQPGDAGFNELKEITDTSDPTNMERKMKRIKRMIFPTRRSRTDMQGAMSRAVTMLTAFPDYPTASNFVVMFSDGLNNCINGACDGTHSQWLNSLFGQYINSVYYPSPVENVINNNYFPSRIPFYQILIGKIVAPALPFRRSSSFSPGDCIHEDSQYLYGYSVGDTSQAAFNAMSPSTPFTGANYAWSRILGTVEGQKGQFIPLRPCCKKDGACANVYPELDACCNSYVQSSTGYYTSKFVPCAPYTTMYANYYYNLACDPYGLTEKEQMEKHLTRIMKENPYVLVQ